MAGDNTERMLGSVDGKLDSLISSFAEYRVEHNGRHKEIDDKIEEHAADINRAKGAKTALIAAAAAVSGLVSVALAAAERLLK